MTTRPFPMVWRTDYDRALREKVDLSARLTRARDGHMSAMRTVSDVTAELSSEQAESRRLGAALVHALARLEEEKVGRARADARVADLAERLARHNVRGAGGRFAPRPRHAASQTAPDHAEALPPVGAKVPGAGGTAAAASGTAQLHVDRGLLYVRDSYGAELVSAASGTAHANAEALQVSEALLARLHGIPAAEFGDDAARSRAAADAADEAGHVDRAQWMDAFVEAYVCDDDSPVLAAELAWDDRHTA